MTDDIIKSIYRTKEEVSNLNNLPKEQGIYAFFLNRFSTLGIFGKPGQLIYVGISENNLSGRDRDTHLETGKTGWSTFRRSIGAILKEDLKLTAIKRDKNPKKLRADKYKFDSNGEVKLTKWMTNNLEMGYCVISPRLSLVSLKEEEEKVILMAKPTLDLDIRTRKFNPLTNELDRLRAICREEVKLIKM